MDWLPGTSRSLGELLFTQHLTDPQDFELSGALVNNSVSQEWPETFLMTVQTLSNTNTNQCSR